MVFWVCKNQRDCECNHDHQQVVQNKVNGIGCPFCAKHSLKNCIHQSLKYKFPHICDEWDYSKNINLDPEKINIGSSLKVHWKCKLDNTHEWQAKICQRIYNKTNCPFCKNKTENKLFNWLKKNYKKMDITRQMRFDWCKREKTNKLCSYSYDFLIKDYNLLIELDGRQHFTQVSNWDDPKITQERDIFKIKKALENNYSIIRLLQTDVYYDKNNWKNILKNMINQNAYLFVRIMNMISI